MKSDSSTTDGQPALQALYWLLEAAQRRTDTSITFIGTGTAAPPARQRVNQDAFATLGTPSATYAIAFYAMSAQTSQRTAALNVRQILREQPEPAPAKQRSLTTLPQRLVTAL
jgi:hypothetical protein